MRKKFLAAFLALIIGSINAYAVLPTSNLGLDGLELYGEFLWWQAKSDGLFLSVEEVNESLLPAVSDKEYRFWELGYSPGFRLGLAYQPCSWEGLTFYVSGTHFRATDTLTLDLVGVDDVFFRIGTLYDTIADDVIDYRGSLDFLFNRVDVGFMKTMCEYGYLSIMPKLAFTYIHTRLATTENYFNTFEEASNTSSKNSYSGYGATIGFDATYNVGFVSGLAIYSSLGISGLWGPLHYTYDELVDDEVTQALQSINFGRWMTDMQVGLQYNTGFCGGYEFAARLGWEFIYLPDNVNLLFKDANKKNPSAMKINGLTLGVGIGF